MNFIKKLVITIVISIFNVSLFSQSASIEHVRMNVLFQGIENNMSIYFSSKPEDTEVTVSKGQITKTETGYIYSCNEIGTVYFTIKSKSGPTFTKSFRIKELPKPVFRIDDLDNKFIDKLQLANIKLIKGELPDFEYYIHPVISSFKIKVIKHNGEIKLFKNEGSHFNKEFLIYCFGLEKSDVIVFSDINYNYVSSPGEMHEKFIKEGELETIIYVVK